MTSSGKKPVKVGRSRIGILLFASLVSLFAAAPALAADCGCFFDKTAANLTSRVNPTTTANPGDRLRYTLRVRTTNQALANFRIFDDLGALNPQAVFVPGTLTLVTYPLGADISGTSSTGGT